MENDDIFTNKVRGMKNENVILSSICVDYVKANIL